MLRAAILASALLFSSVPEIIVIDVVQPEVPAAIKCEIGEVTEYNWTDDEIKQVAKILWAETGRGNTYKEKQCICYLILNTPSRRRRRRTRHSGSSTCRNRIF